jgi:hypothetical protein
VIDEEAGARLRIRDGKADWFTQGALRDWALAYTYWPSVQHVDGQLRW